MNTRSQFRKWGAVALGGLCVFLVFKLVAEIMGSPVKGGDPGATVSRTQQQGVPPVKSPLKSENGPPGGNLGFEIQGLEEYAAKPLPDIDRDPFNYGPPPLTPAQQAAQAARAASGGFTATTAAAAPQVPLRAIGFAEKFIVGPEAYLTDSDQIYVVHIGDVVLQRYKITGITSTTVEVQDTATHEKVQLPIPETQ
ncbi:MAG TPA: hypothetical protein VFC10_19830 [Terriglobia bacterium]|nr:hypothetical protein [Terriglobia bacterium]